MSDPRDGSAWVTGASSGIGEALALRLARDGWTVHASARSVERLKALEGRAADLPGRIAAAPCDVTDLEAVKATVAAIEGQGPLALAILNAGTYVPDRAQDFDSGGFEKTIGVNVLGTAKCLEALMPAWAARRRGHLAIVASVAGYGGLPTAMAYGASKAALINFAEGLKFDFDRLGLKIQLIDPGFVRTPLTDKNRFRMPALMEVDDAVERIVRGLRSDAFEITFPKRFTYLVKLLRFLPYRLYFPLVRKATNS